MPTWYHIPVAVMVGVAASLIMAFAIAARELGSWRAIRLQLVINNQNHKQRHSEHLS